MQSHDRARQWTLIGRFGCQQAPSAVTFGDERIAAEDCTPILLTVISQLIRRKGGD
jgi:hypothetical protein